MTQAAQLAQYGANNVGLSFKNRILNGDMTVDQRNAGAAVTGQQYLVDRWRSWFDPGTYSFQQVTDAPAGFTNSLRVTKTNTTQSTYGFIVQYIEGFNCADFGFGTASAQTITISFWAKSSITGAFTAAIGNSAENRWYGANYTINAANTWEQKSVTIPGDTTGTWLTNNGTGIQLVFNFGQAASAQAAGVWTTSANARAVTGSTNLGTTNGATWQVTGVQLEKGTVATSFDYLPYGTELALCQRYFYREVGATGEYSYFAVGGCYNSSAGRLFKQYPVTMRAVPTYSAGSGGYIDGVGFNVAFTLNLEYGTVNNARLGFTTASSFGAGQAVFLAQNTNANFSHSFNAEL